MIDTFIKWIQDKTSNFFRHLVLYEFMMGKAQKDNSFAQFDIIQL